MKRVIRIVSAMLMAAIFFATLAGCTFRIAVNNNNGLTFSAEKQTVVFNDAAGDERTKFDSFMEAYNAVKRTSVAIEMSTTAGKTAGSGVIIDMQYENPNNKDVFIVTCHHVIESRGDITLYLPDENCRYDNNDYIFEGYIGGDITGERAVSLIGGDKNSDIAVIRLDLSKKAVSGKILSYENIEKAKIPAENYSLSVAEEVFSVGNPTGGLPGSFSGGYVSYLDRVTSVEDIGNMNLLQINLASNPGNSGGGLYNMYGELVGITNAGNTNYEQINFAIPFESSLAKEDNGFVCIAKELTATYTGTNYGYVEGHREKFGFTVTQSGNSESDYYVSIAAVNEGSLAEKAGLCKGDIITGVAVNGGTEKNVSKVSEVSEIIEGLAIGDKLTVNYSRQGNRPWNGYTKGTATLTACQFRFCNTDK